MVHREVAEYAPQLILDISPDCWLRFSQLLCCSCICTFRYRKGEAQLGTWRYVECTEKVQLEGIQHRDSGRIPHFCISRWRRRRKVEKVAWWGADGFGPVAFDCFIARHRRRVVAFELGQLQ